MNAPPRVRFAPSPTGYLHVGGARTALFNWLFARGAGGAFILRIEDTDRERSDEAMTRAILDGMSWLGLEWDEGPFHQADGIERHRSDAQRLLEQGRAYRCFCSAEELQKRREAAESTSDEAYRYDRSCAALPEHEAQRRLENAEPFTIRFRVPDGTTGWNDVVHGETRFRNQDIEDFVILRTDGTPIYNLAVVSDDIEMEITHVIRGDDHLSNTPKQILLYEALGNPVPTFVHLPMILGSDGKRLSKRHGATAVGEYREQGMLPEALVNFLALLGWNPGDEQEIMTPDVLVERFSLERINKKSSIFDTEKLWWMNGQHISRTPAAELLPLVMPMMISEGLTTEQEIADRLSWFHALIDMVKVRARKLDSIVVQARAYLAPDVEYESAAVDKHWADPEAAIERLQAVRQALEEVEPWTPETVEEALRAAADRQGIGFGKIVHPLRVAITGSAVSPGIDQVVAQMGRELVGRRVDAACALLRQTGAVGNER